MEKVLFYEKQRWRRTKLFVLASVVKIIISAVLAYFFIRVNYDGNPVRIETFSNLYFILFAILASLVILMTTISTSIKILKTKIFRNCIVVTYSTRKGGELKIKPQDIFSYRLRTYKAFHEYFGHGKRNNSFKGKAFTVWGKTGLQLHLKDGSRILIGTQKKQAIKHAMEKLMNKRS